MALNLKSANINSSTKEGKKSSNSIEKEGNLTPTNDNPIAMDIDSPIKVVHHIPKNKASFLPNDEMQDDASLEKYGNHMSKDVNTFSNEVDLLTKGGNSLSMEADSLEKDGNSIPEDAKSLISNEKPLPMDPDSLVKNGKSDSKNVKFLTPNEIPLPMDADSLDDDAAQALDPSKVNSSSTVAPKSPEFIFKTPEKVSNTFANKTPSTPNKDSTPKKPRSPTAEANYNICKARLYSIVKIVEDNCTKWMLAQNRGLTMCNQIESLKLKTWEKNKDSNDKAGNITTEYNETLKKYCDKLAIITSVFADITKSSKEILKQLNILAKLPGIDEEVFFYSWRMHDFLNFINTVVDRYSNELSVKIKVMESIAHCKSTPEIIRCIAAWEYPQDVNAYLLFQFAVLQGETAFTKPYSH